MSNVSSSNGLEKYPKLRFKGFSDPWSNISFGELFTFLPNNTLSRAELNYESGEYQNVHYGDVLIKFGPVLDAATDVLPFITEYNDKNAHKQLLQSGDVIIADTAEDEAVGKATEIINVATRKVVSGLHTIACRPRVEMTPTYLGFYINSEIYHQQLYSLMQGVKVLSISKSNIEGTTLRYPTEAEQQKICALLNLIELKIVKQKKLIELLKKYKRGLLSTIFSKVTTFVHLKDICEYASSAKTMSQIDNTPKGAYPVYDAGGVAAFVDFYDMDTNYIAIIKDGSGVGRLQFCQAKSSFIGTLGGLIPKNCSAFYLYTALQTIDFKEYVTGMAIPHIYYKDYKDAMLPYPCEEERAKIEIAFQYLDDKIAKAELLLTKLNELKKSFLQQLFI